MIQSEMRREVEYFLANQTVVGHLTSAILGFFSFKFSVSAGCLFWALERLFQFGDYKRGSGKFYRLGYIR